MIKIFAMKKIFILFSILLSSSLSTYAIEVSRTVFPNKIKKGEGAVISVTIKKQGEEGFAKLMEVIPEGFRAEEMNSANGNFISEGGQIRIIWLTMPDGDEFKAEYKLIYEGEDKGSFAVNGKFYFVKNEKRTESVIKPSFVKVFKPSENTESGTAPKIEYDTPMPVIPPAEPEKEEPIVSNSVEKESEFENIEPEEEEEEEESPAENDSSSPEDLASDASVESTPEAYESVEKDSENTEVTISMEVSKVETISADLQNEASENIAPEQDYKNENETFVNNVPPVAEGLIFKVQLGAYSKPQSDVSIFGDLPNVHYGQENGLYKYYSGSYTSEYEVRNIIKQAQASGFSGAFLVKFKDGKKL